MPVACFSLAVSCVFWFKCSVWASPLTVTGPVPSLLLPAGCSALQYLPASLRASPSNDRIALVLSFASRMRFSWRSTSASASAVPSLPCHNASKSAGARLRRNAMSDSAALPLVASIAARMTVARLGDSSSPKRFPCAELATAFSTRAATSASSSPILRGAFAFSAMACASKPASSESRCRSPNSKFSCARNAFMDLPPLCRKSTIARSASASALPKSSPVPFAASVAEEMGAAAAVTPLMMLSSSSLSAFSENIRTRSLDAGSFVAESIVATRARRMRRYASSVGSLSAPRRDSSLNTPMSASTNS